MNSVSIGMSPLHRIVPAGVVSAVLALGGVVAVPARALAAGPTCDGQAATIVGVPGKALTGTAGADVIVTHGASKVSALGGGDLICITSATGRADPNSLSPTVLAGPGNDTVEGFPADQASGFPVIELGAGADVMRAPSSADIDSTNYTVDTGDNDDVLAHHAPSHDEVSLGDGDDVVTSGNTGRTNDDDISTGLGADQVTVRGLPTGVLDGGTDGGRLAFRSSRPVAWVIDGAGGGSVDGAPLRQTGFDGYDVDGVSWTSLRFDGSSASEDLEARNSPATNGPAAIDLGGGADTADVASTLRGSIDGGSGSDAVYVYVQDRISHVLDVDLSASLTAGRFQAGSRSPVRLTSIDHFAALGFRHSTISGSQLDDDIYVQGCTARIDGLRGNDLIQLEHAAHCPGRTDPTSRHQQPGLVAHGGRGNDYLVGSIGRDTLYGGPGRDGANGMAGKDTCVSIERPTSC